MQNKSLMVGMLLSFSAMSGIVILAKPIIHLVYERGVFTANDTLQTANTLIAFAYGLPAFIFCKILTPIFFAKQDFKTPFRITIYTMVMNTILNIIFMKIYGYIGIAIGSTLAAWFNFILLYIFSKKHNFVLDASVWSFFIKVSICCGAMIFILLLLSTYYSDYFYHDNVLVKISMLSISVFIGVLVFFVMCILLKLHKAILD